MSLDGLTAAQRREYCTRGPFLKVPEEKRTEVHDSRY